MPIGTGEFRMIHSRVSWMFLPVERSITVSAPQSVAQRSFSTSSSIDERTAELPMLALIFTWKRAADDHRLELGVVDVGRDDRPAARDLAPHELGRQPFAQGDELHLRGDLAAPGVLELGDRAGAAEQRRAGDRPAPARDRRRSRRAGVLDRARRRSRAGAARQSLPHVAALRPAGVVHPERRLAAGERDLAHRHADAARPLDVDLGRVGEMPRRSPGGGRADGRTGATGRTGTSWCGWPSLSLHDRAEGAQRWRGSVAGAALPSPVSAGSGSKGDISIGRQLRLAPMPLAAI